MLAVPSWFLCARAPSSSPQRVSSPGVGFRHTAFAQKRSRNGFRRLQSIQISALSTMATLSPPADFLAWVDVGLLLVDKILGSGVRVETARFMLSDPAPSEARYFPGFTPRQTHGDTAVLKAQEWVHIRDGRDVSIASMAAAAGLERRTFLRRFANATGMTPIEYCRAVRIARARELLEGGNTPQKEIAQSLAYRDVASFARVFRKVTGLAPGAYRKRFGLSARSHDYFAEGRAAAKQLPQVTAKAELMDREAASV